MAYPRSRSFRYFGRQTVTPIRAEGERRPVDAEFKAITDAVSNGTMTVEQGVEAMKAYMAKRAGEG